MPQPDKYCQGEKAFSTEKIIFTSFFADLLLRRAWNGHSCASSGQRRKISCSGHDRTRQRDYNVTLGEDTLVLVLRGIKEVDAYRAGTGCFLYFPAGQACTLTNIPDEQGMYLALALSFSDDILARSATLLPPSSPRPGSVPLLLTLLNTFLDLTLLHDDAALARMQMEQILYALRGAGLPLFRNGRDTAADVRALVEEEPGKAWTAADIAARMHMSERSLRRRMEESGTSLGATIRLARLHAGLGLLQQSGFNVAQISVACGYQSPSRFAARFREHFGISPGDVIRSRGMTAGTGAF